MKYAALLLVLLIHSAAAEDTPEAVVAIPKAALQSLFAKNHELFEASQSAIDEVERLQKALRDAKLMSGCV